MAAAAAVVGACSDSAETFDAGPVDALVVPGDATVDAAAQGKPDLIINANRLLVDLAVEQRDFAADACELAPDESCVGGPGVRRLLRFSVETPNIGTADVFLGTPSAGNDKFQYSECHMHYHLLGYASYELVDASGNTIASGHKQAFCLLDSEKYVTDDPSVSDTNMYWCGYQGIQRGWSDVYTAALPCQHVDITGVPDGDYKLRITLNEQHIIDELDYSNNMLEVPVTIGNPDYATPTEPCPDGIDAYSTDGLHRECGWTFAGNFACTPGQLVNIGCVDTGLCNLGACTGDPMLRVCDPDRPDGNCSSAAVLSENDDGCGGSCPLVANVVCPDGGSIAVYHAPYSVGDAYTCDVQVN